MIYPQQFVEVCSKWTELEITDRGSGEVDRLSLQSDEVSARVAKAAESAAVTIEQAWNSLGKGQHVTTFSFVYRLRS